MVCFLPWVLSHAAAAAAAKGVHVPRSGLINAHTNICSPSLNLSTTPMSCPVEGHDPNDYEIGKRHSLETINLMEKDGTMAPTAGAYSGQDRFDCRDNLWADMETAVS